MNPSAPHVTAWSAEHLLAMLADRAYEPPPLGLKCDQAWNPALRQWVPEPGTHKIEVRRVLQDDGEAYIEKRYLGKYANRVRYEANLLELVHNLSLIRDHVVGAVGKFERQGKGGTTLVMPWAGLSVNDWNGLLGEASPFRSSCVALLALVRAVLRATDDFHAAGFVHGDLLPQNIVIQHQASSKTGWWRLNLAETRLIDLEFSLPPLQQIRDETGKRVQHDREWFRDIDGELIWLYPPAHSPQLLPGPIELVRGNWVKHPMNADADARLQRIDWGADFFSLAYWLQAMVETGNFYVDEDARPDVMRYLRGLPDQLRAFDRPVDVAAGEAVPRPDRPHSGFIREISRLIGAHDNASSLDFRLPTRDESRKRGRAAPTEISTVEQQPVPPSQTPTPNPTPQPTPTPTPTPRPTPSPRPVVTTQPAEGRFTKAAFVVGVLGVGAGALVLMVGQDTKSELPQKLVRPPAISSTPTPAPAPTPAPTPAPPPIPTPGEQLATAAVAVQAAPPGSPAWLAALERAVPLAADAKVPATDRSQFWSAVQTAYLRQTGAVTQGPWWRSPASAGQAPGEAEKAWLTSTRTLAAQGIWVAATYLARATAAGHAVAKTDSKADAAVREQAQADLSRLLTNLKPGPEPALEPAKLQQLRMEGAELLFNLALYDVGLARRARQAVSAQPAARLLPVLKVLADEPNAVAQVMLGYTALCLQPTTDVALARAQYERAAKASGTDPASLQAVQEAIRELTAMQSAKMPTDLCR